RLTAESGRWRSGELARRPAAPHRPDSARALGLRARIIVLTAYRRPTYFRRRIPMTPHSWICQLFVRTSRPAPRSPRPPPRFRPRLDVLEDRLTPTNLGTTALLEGPAAGNASVVVSSATTWSASSNAAWLHTSASGFGNGLATFTLDA